MCSSWIRLPLLLLMLLALLLALPRLLLLPGAKPPVAVQSRGKQICTCFNVTDFAIPKRLVTCQGNETERLAALQDSLKCGTNCGSCLPQLQRMVRTTMAVPAVA